MKNLIFVVIVLSGTCLYGQSFFSLPQIPADSFRITSNGIRYFIYRHGQGAEVTPGDRVYIDYVGRFTNDSVFFTTIDKGPLPYNLSSGQLIRGFEQSLLMLHQGDRARIIVPWQLAYGEKSYRNFPARSNLIFDVEIVALWSDDPPEPFINGPVNWQKTRSGLEYFIVDSGNNQKPGNNQRVLMHYTGYFTDGTIFDSSVKRENPYELIVGDGMAIKAWDEAVQMIGKNGKIRIRSPWKLAYGKKGLYPVVPPKTNVIFDIELVETFPEVEIIPFDTTNITCTTTPEGIKIWVISTGSGEIIDTSKVASVHYSGYLSNGKLFDSSVKRGNPVLIPVGAGMVIPGWEIALLHLHKGDKARIFIPYRYGYGKKGNKPLVPPKADLYFDVEIVENF